MLSAVLTAGVLLAFLPTVVEAQVWRLTGTSFRAGGHALFVIDPMQRIHRGVQACMHRDGLCSTSVPSHMAAPLTRPLDPVAS